MNMCIISSENFSCGRRCDRIPRIRSRRRTMIEIWWRRFISTRRFGSAMTSWWFDIWHIVLWGEVFIVVPSAVGWIFLPWIIHCPTVRWILLLGGVHILYLCPIYWTSVPLRHFRHISKRTVVFFRVRCRSVVVWSVWSVILGATWHYIRHVSTCSRMTWSDIRCVATGTPVSLFRWSWSGLSKKDIIILITSTVFLLNKLFKTAKEWL